MPNHIVDGRLVVSASVEIDMARVAAMKDAIRKTVRFSASQDAAFTELGAYRKFIHDRLEGEWCAYKNIALTELSALFTVDRD